MTEPLVDSDGFPRADIDVHAVRISRSELKKLENDHKVMMMRIEKALHVIHAATPASSERARAYLLVPSQGSDTLPPATGLTSFAAKSKRAPA